MQKAAHAYLSTQVTTTDQGELLIMLYDGAIKYMTQAKEKIMARDYAAKGILLGKALDIIAELSNSLNKDKGGELAQNLNKLYVYCNAKLLFVNLKMDLAVLDHVIQIVTGLRSAYAEIIKGGGQVQENGAFQIKPGSEPEAHAAAAAVQATAAAVKQQSGQGTSSGTARPQLKANPQTPKQQAAKSQAARPQAQAKPQAPKPQAPKQQAPKQQAATPQAQAKPQQSRPAAKPAAKSAENADTPQPNPPRPATPDFARRKAAAAYANGGK